MKFEHADHDILAGVFLKAKNYCLLLKPSKYLQMQNRDIETKQIVKCKGVSQSAINHLKFENYLHTLSQDEINTVSYTKLRPSHHVIHETYEQKQALSSFDDKRHLSHCSIHSQAYGDVNLSQVCNICQ